MKFLLDANMPYSAKEVFRKPDDVFHVRDIGLASATDEEIRKKALESEAVLVTRDLDFANIILHPLATHHGIVVLRVPSYFTAKQIVSVLKLFFLKIQKTDLIDRLTILEPGRYRTRSK